MSSPRSQALAQRVNVQYHLGSMTWDETKAYVAHHFQLAGVTHALITEAALRQVFQQSHGLPRSVNRLILRTLDLAYCHQRQIVDEEMVELALAE